MINIDTLMTALITTANKSPIQYKHAACIIENNKILSLCYNTESVYIKNGSIHAEINAIYNISKCKKLTNCTIIIIRISKDNTLRYSKPCSNCMETIKRKGIKNIIYSLNAVDTRNLLYKHINHLP
jgi:deoxycytidylate deaminase